MDNQIEGPFENQSEEIGFAFRDIGRVFETAEGTAFGAGTVTGVAKVEKRAYPGTIAMKAANGQNLYAAGGGGGAVGAGSDNLSIGEVFTLIDRGNGQVALQTFTGHYLMAQGGGGGAVGANSFNLATWETFTLIDRGNGQVALQALNGQYVCAEGGGGGTLIANRAAIGPWETFKLIDLSSSVIIYQHENYGGTSQALTEGSYDLNSLGIGGDQLSSIIIPTGMKATLYAHPGFIGSAKTFTQDAAWVGEDFNDSTSAVKVEILSSNGTVSTVIDVQKQRSAARTARIILRREPKAAELPAWTSLIGDLDNDPVNLIAALLAMPEAGLIDEATRLARSWDATFGRYDAKPPASLAHWQQRHKLALDENPSLNHNTFITNSLLTPFSEIKTSGYRNDACASPVDKILYAVRDAAGAPLIFSVGENRHLYLFRKGSTGQWQQTDLSAGQTWARSHVLSLDVKQNAMGVIALAIAIGPRRGNGPSTVHASLSLSNALDEAGWLRAMQILPECSGRPDEAIVSHVAFEPFDSSGNAKLYVGAIVKGIPNSYYFDAQAAPTAVWVQLRIPEDANSVLHYEFGQYVNPGVFTLYQVGKDAALTFSTSTPDQYGKIINVSYTQLPTATTSFRVAASGTSRKPDVYVAGNGLVVYRGNNANPEVIVTGVKGVRLVWISTTAAGERLAFIDSTSQLKLVSRTSGRSWSTPYTISSGLEAAILLGDPADPDLTVVAVTLGYGLELRRIALPNTLPVITEIPLQAVWQETPLNATELKDAISAAGPLVYFDAKEEFYPSPVEFFLSRAGLWNEMKGTWQLPKGTLLDPETKDLSAAAVSRFPRSDSSNSKHSFDYVLKIDDADLADLKPGQLDNAPLYVHAKFNPSENATDLVFWIFYPYNGAGVLKLATLGLDRHIDLEPLGMHEGDWEHFLIRVDNDTKQPNKLYLSAHDGGGWTNVSDVTRDSATGRLIVYTSRHGHACYITQGNNLSKKASGGQAWSIGFVNHCDAGRSIKVWEDNRTKLIAASFLNEQEPAEPQWLKLPWRWGRYRTYAASELANVIQRIIGPTPLSYAVAETLVYKKILGGEGYSVGPEAIKFKTSWFGKE